eukprot:scaffold81716_cov58-Attheya_sp.AAC.2
MKLPNSLLWTWLGSRRHHGGVPPKGDPLHVRPYLLHRWAHSRMGVHNPLTCHVPRREDPMHHRCDRCGPVGFGGSWHRRRGLPAGLERMPHKNVPC